MNNEANLLPQAPPPRGLGKHQLNPKGKAPPVPEIDHWVLQLWGVSPDRINDPARLSALLGEAVGELQLTRVSDHTHFFGPGVSTVIILSESHLSAHTWPELGYIHLDLVTCAKQLTAEGMEAVFCSAFAPNQIQLDRLEY